MTKLKPDDNYITKTAVLKRGWTASLLNKFIPAPHSIKPNYMYHSAAPIKLYRIETIDAIEQSDEFKKLAVKAQKRKQAAVKAVKTKKDKLAKAVESMTFKVPVFSTNELLDRAVAAYNENQIDIGKDNYASKKSDKLFLQRIMVNYIRHELTSYDAQLIKIFGKVGTDNAYVDIRKKVLDKISETYPHLRKECERQKRSLWTF